MIRTRGNRLSLATNAERVCAEIMRQQKVRRARPWLGTFVEIEVAGSSGPEMVAAVDAAFEAVAKVHRLMSFHDADSDVSRLNRDAHVKPIAVHAWTFAVLEAAVELHRRSNGIFDIAVAPVMQALGLLPGTRERASAASGRRAFGAIELMDGHAVRFHGENIGIDLGGIAKGFAVDRALEVLRGFGIESAIVNAGGDLAAFGAEPHAVHIRHPRNPAQLVCSVEIRNEALASSARRFDLFHTADTADTAVIDPATRRAPEIIDGVTVRAPSCMIADALTKIVMIAGTEASDLLDHYRASALLISADGTLQISSDFQRAVHLAA
jgi:FAD:protein FMN transferase